MAQPRPGNYPHPDVHVVSPGYVQTLGISLLRGRSFTETDKEDAPLVAMINQRLANQFFPNEDPIGKRFMFGHPNTERPRLSGSLSLAYSGDTRSCTACKTYRVSGKCIYRSARPRPDRWTC